jgi:HTH domain
MIDDSKITIPQLSKKLNVSTKTIERDIEKLKEENKIYRQGNSRDGTWIVLE